MSSSLLITLIALGIISGLAFFVSAGFRGSGKVSDYAPNLTKYRTDDDLETKTLDRTLDETLDITLDETLDGIVDATLDGTFSAVSTPTVQPNTHFVALFQIYKMFALLHRSKLINLA